MERHFETLLARPRLCVRVGDGIVPPAAAAAATAPAYHTCHPFDYAAVPGRRLTRLLPVAVGGKTGALGT